MKTLFFIIVLILLETTIYSQCPQSGIKVLSKGCESPKDLTIVSINCAELKVKWKGSPDQTYVVKASEATADTENAAAVRTSEPVCDNSGNCTVNIEVQQGVTINWSVQSICTAQGVTTYSEPVNGPDAYIPICNKVNKRSLTTGLQAYPNPCRGMLTIDYTGKIEGALQINVYDVNGKQVFTQRVTATSKTSNQYQLNLHTLTPGTYLLQTVNGTETKQVKFVLMKE